jgi:four helix bundle protein
MAVKNYSELIVWQKAVDFVVAVYDAARTFPRDEMYGLTSQIKRAVVSVPSNIAEGQGRRTSKEFVHFLYVANGSLREVETQVAIAHRLKFITDEKKADLLRMSSEVGRILYGLINSLDNNATE